MGAPMPEQQMVVEIVQESNNWIPIISSIIAGVIGLIGTIITVKIKKKRR